MAVNNVNLEALEKMAGAIRQDAGKGKRTNRVEGTWNLAGGQPQFSADLSFEGGKLTLEADQPTFLGGGGARPGPMLYALYGLASCFTATFVTLASQEALPLEEVKATVETDLDFYKVFGIADLPIVEQVRVNLAVKSSAGRDALERVLKLAEERCPAAWCLRNPIPLAAKLV
ncbi:MAG: OsmC family protein [Dehalococcoidia bacterium]|nr:OsmC family protein [Dehalococcoidia bacterium]